MKIKMVKLVKGYELVDYWADDMCVVRGEIGGRSREYVAHAWTAPYWGSMLGQDVDATVEQCKADSRLMWIKFPADYEV